MRTAKLKMWVEMDRHRGCGEGASGLLFGYSVIHYRIRIRSSAVWLWVLDTLEEVVEAGREHCLGAGV